MGIPDISPYAMPGEDELPTGQVPWEPDASRAVLLVHDMQRYFLAPFRPFSSPASQLKRNATALVRLCRALGVPVTYTAQPGGMTAAERGLLADLWGSGMTTDPRDQAIVSEVAPVGDERVFTKWRYSAFHNTGLLAYLRGIGRDQLLICGVYARLGCLITASDAFSHDVQPFLIADAVADFTLADHRMALDYAVRGCARVLPTRAALASLTSVPNALGA